MAGSLDTRVRHIVEVLQDRKALDILLMDLRSLTDAADYFVLCTGTSDQHVRSLADSLVESLTAVGDAPWHVEGYATRRWVLIDCVDIVVHVFRQEARQFYALERLWGDAALTSFEDTWQTDQQEGVPGNGEGDDDRAPGSD
ncbi:MAG: ribosome silencing factor [Candidatus Latescibacterota bacterium]